MKPFKHRLKINSKTTQKPKETTDQLKIGSDHAYQKMIRRVLDEGIEAVCQELKIKSVNPNIDNKDKK